jgi:hypothetical protein
MYGHVNFIPESKKDERWKGFSNNVYSTAGLHNFKVHVGQM